MKKTVVKIVTCLCILFAILNCIWFFYWHSFRSYKNAVGYEESTDRYITVDSDGYRYAVFAPGYLRFQGNLTVGNAVWGEETDECACSLIIWPLFSGGYEYGITIYVPVSTESGYAYESYSFTMDENGEPLSEELSEDEIQLLEDNTEKIELVYQKAYEMWGIGVSNS
ncbi:MAG: hypothetical protein LUE29_04795 [Lachnospiraceae bacterium]|nr:hypothetical protein [Lachnospiraceae bacterium]